MPPRSPVELEWLSESAAPVLRDWARALSEPGVPAAACADALRKLAFVHRQSPWLPVPLDDRWVAAYRLGVQAGAVIVTELRVFPRERPGHAVPGTWSAEVLGIKAKAPWGGITSRLLRRVKVGEHHRVADAVLRRNEGWYPMALGLEPRRPPGPGRPRRADLWYAKIAEAYDNAVRAGSRHPIADAARAQRMRPAWVRDAIHRARRRGLLGPTPRGQRGGTLTPKAIALLDRDKGKGAKAKRAGSRRRTRTPTARRRT